TQWYAQYSGYYFQQGEVQSFLVFLDLVFDEVVCYSLFVQIPAIAFGSGESFVLCMWNTDISSKYFLRLIFDYLSILINVISQFIRETLCFGMCIAIFRLTF